MRLELPISQLRFRALFVTLILLAPMSGRCGLHSGIAEQPAATITVTLGNGEKRTLTWRKWLSLRGIVIDLYGFSSLARPRNAVIIRDGKRVAYDLQRISRGKKQPDPNLQPGDAVESIEKWFNF